MSDRMSQSEIDALIAQMTTAENETAASFAVPEAHPAQAGQTPPESSTALSQAEIDALFSTTSQPEPVDRGIISQSEVDALVGAAASKRESMAAEAQKRLQPAAVQPLGLSSLLMEISLVLTVELGRTKMPLKQVLGLSPGSVITLEEHIATEPVQVLINETPVMKAEVVVIGENYGIRLTESRLTRKVS